MCFVWKLRKTGPGRRWLRCLNDMLSATQGGRQERHTSLIKAVFLASGFTSGCHVNSEEELGAWLVEVHRKSNLQWRRKTNVFRCSNFFQTSLWKGSLLRERTKRKAKRADRIPPLFRILARSPIYHRPAACLKATQACTSELIRQLDKLPRGEGGKANCYGMVPHPGGVLNS